MRFSNEFVDALEILRDARAHRTQAQAIRIGKKKFLKFLKKTRFLAKTVLSGLHFASDRFAQCHVVQPNNYLGQIWEGKKISIFFNFWDFFDFWDFYLEYSAIVMKGRKVTCRSLAIPNAPEFPPLPNDLEVDQRRRKLRKKVKKCNSNFRGPTCNPRGAPSQSTSTTGRRREQWWSTPRSPCSTPTP